MAPAGRDADSGMHGWANLNPLFYLAANEAGDADGVGQGRRAASVGPRRDKGEAGEILQAEGGHADRLY